MPMPRRLFDLMSQNVIALPGTVPEVDSEIEELKRRYCNIPMESLPLSASTLLLCDQIFDELTTLYERRLAIITARS